MRKNTIAIYLEDTEGGINLSVIPEHEIPESGPLTDAERASSLIFKLLEAMHSSTSFDPTNN